MLTQIAELERERDAVVETEAFDKASKMIQQLTGLRGIGVQSATVLVRGAFVRRFANGKALGSYAGLASSPYSSGGIDREQGIGKAGSRRVRTVMVELAWLPHCRGTTEPDPPRLRAISCFGARRAAGAIAGEACAGWGRARDHHPV